MAYHNASNLVAYSPEQAMLKKYLQRGFDPYDYSYELEEWLEKHICEECGAGDNPECDMCEGELKASVDKVTGGDSLGIETAPGGQNDPLEWIETASDSDLARFREYVEQSNARRDMGPDRPVYEHMSFSRLVKPTWMVHFTNDPLEIASDGFKYGWDSTVGLGLTTMFTDQARKHGPGYNFAFVLGSQEARKAASESKYGKHAVVFWAGGVEAWHSGDEEDQVIFWGPEVSASRIFAMNNGGDDGWMVYDATERVVFGVDPYAPYNLKAVTKDFEEAAKWVSINHRMLSGTKERVEGVEKGRHKAAAREDHGLHL